MQVPFKPVPNATQAGELLIAHIAEARQDLPVEAGQVD